ncbi:MAG: TIGR04086 family membrane protein [Clostridia bacterium]|nr:TIGR04086 family membrane protein [Clostridia bacterium]
MPVLHRRAARNAEPRLIRSLAFGTLGGIVCASLCLLVFSLLLSRLSDPRAWMLPLALFTQAASAFAAGYIGGATYRRAGAVAGLGAGVVFTLLLLLSSFFAGAGQGGAEWLRILCYPVCVLLSAVGGMLAARRGERRRRRHA